MEICGCPVALSFFLLEPLLCNLYVGYSSNMIIFPHFLFRLLTTPSGLEILLSSRPLSDALAIPPKGILYCTPPIVPTQEATCSSMCGTKAPLSSKRMCQPFSNGCLFPVFMNTVLDVILRNVAINKTPLVSPALISRNVV